MALVFEVQSLQPTADVYVKYEDREFRENLQKIGVNEEIKSEMC